MKSELKGQNFCDATDIIKNVMEELKYFHKTASRNVSSASTVAVGSVYLCKGILWKYGTYIIALFCISNK